MFGRINCDVMLLHRHHYINFDRSYLVALHAVERRSARRVDVYLFAIAHNTERSVNDVSIRIQTHSGCEEKFSVARIPIEEVPVIGARVA